MKKTTLLILAITSLLNIIPAGAQQIKNFSDSSVFIDEIIEFMKTKKEADQLLLQEFEGYYRSGAFNDEEKADLILFSNKMLGRRARPYPHFGNMVSAYNSFKTSGLPGDEYQAWKQGFNDLLDNKKFNINSTSTFLNLTSETLINNTVYYSRSLKWKAGKGSMKMVYDKGLRYEYRDAKLICYSQRDSILIYGTSGDYDPAYFKWKGKGGKVDWERAALDPGEVYALLDGYNIDMKKSYYQADSVSFHHPNYFPKGEKGNFKDRVKTLSSPNRATFPEFIPFNSSLKLENIYPNINYEGGLEIHGAMVNGFGTEHEPARIKIYKDDSLKMLVRTAALQLKGNRLTSSNASTSIYLGNDSIFHPNIAFRYMVDKREISLYQTDHILTSAPYFDSYHMIDMNFDQLVWDMKDPFLRMTMARGASMGEARFRSSSFFSEREYVKMQALDDVHPLVLLKRFSDWYYSEEFPVSELAGRMGKPQYQVEKLVTRMALDGFVFYKPETGIISIKPSLYDFIQANAGNIDYDVINFISRVAAPHDNAVLNLETKELKVYGIPSVFISDSQNVDIIPTGNMINLKKNRDFDFGGRVQAGMLEFYGDGFSFSYDSFKIHLDRIDSLNMVVLTEEVDDYGNLIPARVKNNIEQITGELLIDHPSNKSGLENFEEFPSFESTANSFVFYEVTEGMDTTLYPRDKFFYQLHPFVLHNLTRLQRSDLSFAGEFHAGNIFPVMYDNLAVQEDLSLGFRHETAEEGLPVYGGLGTYYQEVSLSNRGIEGSGKLKFGNSTTYSENYNFFPDSMLAVANRFQVEKDSIEPTFPYVSGHNNNIKWYPAEDEWYAFKKDENFSIFSEDIKLNGDILMSSKGIKASGDMHLKEAIIGSKEIICSDVAFTADSSTMKMKSGDGKDFSILAEQVSSSVNTAEGSAVFQSINDTVPLVFPEKSYISAVDILFWDINDNEIEMINQDPRNDIYKLQPWVNEKDWDELPTFVSTNPKSDSLGFASDSAIYALDDHTLTAYNVDYLEIADAKIFPGNESLTLERTGFMKGFTDARIIANDKHKIIAEKINILSRNNYFGSGFYNYIDKDNASQRVRLGDVKVNKQGFTYARGEIARADSFMLSQHFWFDGILQLDAEKEFLDFTGGVSLTHYCDSIHRNRIKFSASIDPANIMIPIEEKTKTPDAHNIYKGIYITTMNPEIYTPFFSSRRNYSDIPICTSWGFLVFDKKDKEYKVASEEKLADHSLPGQLIGLKKDRCLSYGEGMLDLAINFHHVEISTTGNISNRLTEGEAEINMLLGMNFFFSDEALQIMANEINSKPTLKAMDMGNPDYIHATNELLGVKKAKEIQDEPQLFGGTGEVVSGLAHTITLGKLKLIWNRELSSYISEGEIGISNINGIPVNRMCKAYVEIQKKRSGDIIDIYLKPDEKTWYYFGYTRGNMQAYSSNADFLDILTALELKERSLKVKSNEVPYVYMVASDRKVANFRRRMNMVLEDETPVGEENIENEY